MIKAYPNDKDTVDAMIQADLDVIVERYKMKNAFFAFSVTDDKGDIWSAFTKDHTVELGWYLEKCLKETIKILKIEELK